MQHHRTRRVQRSIHWSRREFLAAGAGSLGAATLAGGLPSGAAAQEGMRFRPAVVSEGGVVACMNPQAARVGIDALRAGGNAADASLIFAIGFTQPDIGARAKTFTFSEARR